MATEVSRSQFIVVLALAAVIAAPLVDAHLSGARPILQSRQLTRIVDLQPYDPGVAVNLQLENDALRHLVAHRIDPSTGEFFLEYRKEPSVAEDRFFATWTFTRLVEYRDLNFNGLFEPASDTTLKAWRFDQFDWRRLALQAVILEDVQGTSGVWEGNLTGAPNMRMEVAFAGKDFTDEGAFVRPQDVILYFDVKNIPTRGIGSLHALEIETTVQAGTALRFHTVNQTQAALLADSGLRRGLLVWGGEAFLDGREQRLTSTLEEERVDETGNKTARLVIHLPTVDQSMRFVMVSGAEYVVEASRSPTPLPAQLVVLALAVAVLFRRR